MSRIETPRSQLAARLGMPILSERIVRDASPLVMLSANCGDFGEAVDRISEVVRRFADSFKLTPELAVGTEPLL